MHGLRDMILILLLIAGDLTLKYLIHDLGRWTELSWLTTVFNTGISRGIPISYRIVIPVSIIAVMIFAYQYSMRYLTSWAFVPFVAGAIGNLVDRIRLGGVRDFIDIGAVVPGFPIFNLADILISIGIIMLIRWTIRTDSDVAHRDV